MLLLELGELVQRRHRDFVERGDGRLVHASGEIIFAAICGGVAEPVRRFELACDARMRVIIIIERILGLSPVNLNAREASVHVHDEIIGVVLAAGPFGQAQRPLLSDGPCGGAFENRLALRRGQLPA